MRRKRSRGKAGYVVVASRIGGNDILSPHPVNAYVETALFSKNFGISQDGKKRIVIIPGIS